MRFTVICPEASCEGFVFLWFRQVGPAKVNRSSIDTDEGLAGGLVCTQLRNSCRFRQSDLEQA